MTAFERVRQPADKYSPINDYLSESSHYFNHYLIIPLFACDAYTLLPIRPRLHLLHYYMVGQIHHFVRVP